MDFLRRCGVFSAAPLDGTGTGHSFLVPVAGFGLTPKESTLLLALVALPDNRPSFTAHPAPPAQRPVPPPRGRTVSVMQRTLPVLVLLLAALAALAAPAPGRAQDGPMIPLLTPRLNRENPRETLRQAEAALARGERDLAWELATKAINSGDLDQPALAGAYVWRGRLGLDAGDAGQALADFRRGVELAPAASDALAWRARAWLALDAQDPALDDARRAAALTPDSPAAHLALGLALTARGAPAEAAAALERALQLAPDDPETAAALAAARDALR